MVVAENFDSGGQEVDVHFFATAGQNKTPSKTRFAGFAHTIKGLHNWRML